jgi:hypothetical protein
VAVRDIAYQNIKDSKYDYIVIAGALERSKNPVEFLSKLKGSLDENGRLLLIADNRLGIRYFCGDRDVFTGNNFDSIENYTRLNVNDNGKIGGHAYAKAEIIEMLEKSGFSNHHLPASIFR